MIVGKFYTLVAGILGSIAIQFSIEATEGFYPRAAESAMMAVVKVSKTQFCGISRYPSDSPFEDFFGFDAGELPSNSNVSDKTPDSNSHIREKIESSESGFIIKSDQSSALIVTLYPFVANADKISVFLHNQLELEATIMGFDCCLGLAVLKVSTSHLPPYQQILPTLEWADSNVAEERDCIMAVGNRFGLGNTITSGIITDFLQPLRLNGKQNNIKFIQHNACHTSGAFGGPLLNMDGKVIGINAFSIKSRASCDEEYTHLPINFSIPSGLASDRIRSLIEFARVPYGLLGVTPDSPVAKANIQPDDIIPNHDPFNS